MVGFHELTFHVASVMKFPVKVDPPFPRSISWSIVSMLSVGVGGSLSLHLMGGIGPDPSQAILVTAALLLLAANLRLQRQNRLSSSPQNRSQNGGLKRQKLEFSTKKLESSLKKLESSSKKLEISSKDERRIRGGLEAFSEDELELTVPVTPSGKNETINLLTTLSDSVNKMLRNQSFGGVRKALRFDSAKPVVINDNAGSLVKQQMSKGYREEFSDCEDGLDFGLMKTSKKNLTKSSSSSYASASSSSKTSELSSMQSFSTNGSSRPNSSNSEFGTNSTSFSLNSISMPSSLSVGDNSAINTLDYMNLQSSAHKHSNLSFSQPSSLSSTESKNRVSSARKCSPFSLNSVEGKNSLSSARKCSPRVRNNQTLPTTLTEFDAAMNVSVSGSPKAISTAYLSKVSTFHLNMNFH